ncbi:MAG TPA: D-serine ammonia-lyase [Planococcus sp. (in: firmicutes)]|nr:D-serine ammonia-lyase [Planococcus sp. (in: firmicutes)]
MSFSREEISAWKQQHPLLENIIGLDPVFWLNPKLNGSDGLASISVTKEEMEEADRLWHRFAPFLAETFPETAEAEGNVESPLKTIPKMKEKLVEKYGARFEGELYLKCDHALPIAGSVKARGGVYEVLHHAEGLAIDAGMISKEDDYKRFSSVEFIEFFSQYSIGVGSTGNLGLSIGIIGAKLGFRVSVYMSADAKQWKKDLLRSIGATVLEFEGDFSEAITEGREQTRHDPTSYFVDDEKSKELFLGYSTAAFRLKKQLDDQGIRVDSDHPLFIYLPCGVGGAPGGITFGMKQVFGNAVHCFFVEPTHSPAVLVGLMTGEKEKVCVQDFGIDNITEGDGLAVGRPSSFASSISEKLVSGIYTIEDADLFKLLALLADSEGIFVEPSATAGLLGPGKVAQTDYTVDHKLNMKKAIHIVWSTGGALVPKEDMEAYREKGMEFLGG